MSERARALALLAICFAGPLWIMAEFTLFQGLIMGAMTVLACHFLVDGGS
jgi:hypothetical protein